MLYIKRVVARKPLNVVRDSFHPGMAWGLGVSVVDCVADAHGEGWGEVHHPLCKQPPNVNCQAGDDHRDLGFSGAVTLGLNYLEECSRAGKVQGIDVSES